MRWFKIKKYPKPTSGRYYYDWKSVLADEAKQQCVYCAIHVKPFGGIRNFHVEHYKPKSIKKFKKLEHDYNNLFFSCSICNCFKGNDWPNDPNSTLNIKCYPDPTQTDYSKLFEINPSDFSVSGKKYATKYMVEKLFLNRPQLKLERRASSISEKIKETLKEVSDLVNELKKKRANDPDPEKRILIESFLNVIETANLLNEERYLIPYTEEQITR